MSQILLDTHVLVWLLEGSQRMGSKSRQLISNAAVRTEVAFSAITPWEIAMLVARGRLGLDRDVLQWLEEAEAKPGLQLVPITTQIAVESTRLPDSFNADPADRIIAATSRRLGAVLVTADAALLSYADKGHLKAHAATG